MTNSIASPKWFVIGPILLSQFLLTSMYWRNQSTSEVSLWPNRKPTVQMRLQHSRLRFFQKQKKEKRKKKATKLLLLLLCRIAQEKAVSPSLWGELVGALDIWPSNQIDCTRLVCMQPIKKASLTLSCYWSVPKANR